MIEPYKGRTFDRKKRVEVYRNLNRREGGPWYSIRQNGVVVGHTKDVTLKNVYFVVRDAGRKRVLRTGRKNVHAWALGYIDPRQSRYDLGSAMPGKYNPRSDSCFMIFNESGLTPDGWEPVSVAMKAKLGPMGLQVWMKRL
jgi:hypothetical protein